jgi:heme oxygenase (mycobilin-producing)
MYVSMSRLRIAPENAAALVSAFKARLGRVEDHEGFRGLEVWQSDRDSGEILMVSRWRDRECFKAYMKSEDHRESHDRIPPDLQHAIKLESLEHMHTFEVVAE